MGFSKALSTSHTLLLVKLVGILFLEFNGSRVTPEQGIFTASKPYCSQAANSLGISVILPGDPIILTWFPCPSGSPQDWRCCNTLSLGKCGAEDLLLFLPTRMRALRTGGFGLGLLLGAECTDLALQISRVTQQLGADGWHQRAAWRDSPESGELKNNITGDLFVVSVPGLSKKCKEWLVLSARHS